MKQPDREHLWNRIIVAVLLVAFTCLLPVAGQSQTNAGYAGSFLRMGLGARGIGMANTLPAGSQDVYGFFYNPAALPTLESRHFGTTYGFLPLDRSYNYIGFAMPLPPTAGIGLGWFSTGVDDIQGRDFSGKKIETYSVRQHTYMISFGNRFSKYVSVGALLKIMRNDLQELAATGVGFDIGAVIQPHQRIALAVSAQNFNAKFSWNTEDVYSQGSTVINDFPLIFRIGGQVQVLDNLDLYGEYERSDRGAVVFRGAAEYAPMEMVRIRAGVADGHLRFGGGLEYGFFGPVENTSMDYAFVPGLVGEGISHYFSWSFQF